MTQPFLACISVCPLLPTSVEFGIRPCSPNWTAVFRRIPGGSLETVLALYVIPTPMTCQRWSLPFYVGAVPMSRLPSFVPFVRHQNQFRNHSGSSKHNSYLRPFFTIFGTFSIAIFQCAANCTKLPMPIVQSCTRLRLGEFLLIFWYGKFPFVNFSKAQPNLV